MHDMASCTQVAYELSWQYFPLWQCSRPCMEMAQDLAFLGLE